MRFAFPAVIFFLFLAASKLEITCAEEPTRSTAIVQYGTMHEAIGKKQSQGRVDVLGLVEQPHFFGVGALAGLEGEISVWDGKVITTRVGQAGRLQSDVHAGDAILATMLVGSYLESPQTQKIESDVAADKFDGFLAQTADSLSVDTKLAFVFALEGEFQNVHLHVIRGACPIHARINRIQLPEDVKPFEADYERVRGRMVGVYAKDSAGKLTHPSTATHRHLIFKQPGTERWLTGHVEQAGVFAGSKLLLPAKVGE